MKLTETEIRDKEMEPYFTDNHIIWRVKNPKISYKYKLYFSLEKRSKITF